MTKLKEGDKAPSFKEFAAQEGKWVLVYFYPKDDTPGCAVEACMLRDNWPSFKKLKTVVLGVSADTEEKHAKFKKKYDLPFVLVPDTEKEIIKSYGVWRKKKMMGREYMGIVRTSFLVDPQGKIAKIYENVKPKVHAEEVLEDLGFKE